LTVEEIGPWIMGMTSSGREPLFSKFSANPRSFFSKERHDKDIERRCGSQMPGKKEL